MEKTNRKVQGAEPACNGRRDGGVLENGNTCSKTPCVAFAQYSTMADCISVSKARAALRCTVADQDIVLTHGLKSMDNWTM